MTPRQLFLEDRYASAEHSNYVNSAAFEKAVIHSMAEYMLKLPRTHEPLPAAEANARRAGAVEFIDILRHIADPISPPAKSNSGGLLPESDARSR